MFTLNCKGRLLLIDRPITMGILNTTPDSFYAASRTDSEEQVRQQAQKMVEEGASILDIGGQSTRPGAEKISAVEEADRVLPAIRLVRQIFPEIFISIDTYYAEVARQAIEEGADMVNDISGGTLDPDMIRTVSDLNVPFIAMHMKGSPQTMQQETSYLDLMPEIMDHLSQRVLLLEKAGIKDIILDPGFGFAKTREQNFQLLNSLESLQLLRKPILVGLSRKSMIWKTLGISPEEALNGTSVLHTQALMKGALILRVHDVKPAMECIKLCEQLKKQ